MYLPIYYSIKSKCVLLFFFPYCKKKKKIGTAIEVYLTLGYNSIYLPTQKVKKLSFSDNKLNLIFNFIYKID